MSRVATAYSLPEGHVLRRSARAALGLGVLGLAASGAGALVDHAQFFRSWLVAYMYWGGIAFGAFGFIALNQITGGRWGIVIRRICEAAVRTLPLVAVLLIPVVLGIHDLYEWSHLDVVAKDPILLHKAPYLNTGGFITRAVIYFAIWIFCARLFVRWSVEQDATGDPDYVRKFQMLGRAAIICTPLTCQSGAPL